MQVADSQQSNCILGLDSLLTLPIVYAMRVLCNDAGFAALLAMTKIPFTQFTPRTHGKRSIDEAISEVQREMDVRKRLYDKWVAESRMSWVDANDRMERLMSALRWLIQYAQELSQAAAQEEPVTSTPFPLVPNSQLDTQPAVAAA